MRKLSADNRLQINILQEKKPIFGKLPEMSNTVK